MMRRLFKNTVISAISFFISSLLGLIVVPIIISTWGLVQFGLIVLARTFLPLGAFASIDPGISEITTNAVARARVSSDWVGASQTVAFVLIVSTIMGLVIAVALALATPALILGFHVASEDVEGFRTILYATALSNVIFFPSLVADGIVKGFERFPTLRVLDITSVAIYVGATIAAAWAHMSFVAAAIIFLASTLLRCIGVWVVGLGLARSVGLRPFIIPDAATRRAILQRCKIMFQNRLTGGFLGPLLPLAVGGLFGPGAAGLYDVLVRLPRFARQCLSVLNASLLPVAAQIDEHGAHDQIRRLGRAGMLILPAVTVPPLVGAAVFSEPVLRLWIGPAVADHWVWMTIMFVVPIVSQYLSFGSSIMVARPEILRLLNRLAVVQIVVMTVVIVASIKFFDERAFILGQAVACVVVFPLQLSVFRPELRVTRGEIAWNLSIQLLLMVPLAAAIHFAGIPVHLESLLGLAISLAIWCAVIWAAQYLVLLDAPARQEVWLMVKTLLGARWRGAREV